MNEPVAGRSRVACALARLPPCPLPRCSRILCLLPLVRPPSRHGDSEKARKKGVCEQSASASCVSMLRAAGRPGSCRCSIFPVGGTALTRRARARRAWWAHLGGGQRCGCGHIGRSLLFGRQKPWSLSQNLKASNLFSVADPSFLLCRPILLLDEDPTLELKTLVWGTAVLALSRTLSPFSSRSPFSFSARACR